MASALFLFPTDAMGGAESVLRTTARAALASGRYDAITCFVLCRGDHGTLTQLGSDPRVTLVFAKAATEKTGLVALAKVLRADRWSLVMSSHTHLNAAASLARRAGWLRTDRLVTRESTMIFERQLTGRGRLAKHLYAAYGGQDRVVCQSERMAQSLHRHTGDRFANFTHVIENPVDLGQIVAPRGGTVSERCEIVWCGRLAAVKSPHRALNVIAHLEDLAPGRFALTMVGGGDMHAELAQRIEAENLPVTLTGRVDRPALHMVRAELGLLTSDIEGYPNVIIEMLANGVHAVVTTDCAGGLDALPGVHVMPTTDALDMARALLDNANALAPGEALGAMLAERSPSQFLDRILAA